MSRRPPGQHDRPGHDPTLGEVGEAGILRAVLADLPPAPHVLVGPGDDTALVATAGRVLATTDTMVLGRDWRDDWSSGADVGAKVVVQNLADLAAMGGTGTALLLTVVAPGDRRLSWVRELVAGVRAAADAAGVPLVGGDLSSSDGAVTVSVTALGELTAPGPVLRSGAVPGQVVAVSGPLGRAAAGLELLRAADEGRWPPPEAAELATMLVGYHCRPEPDLSQGPVAARAGAGAMIDVSDGLVRDAARVAEASDVTVHLDEAAVLSLADRLRPALDGAGALRCVLGGGEEHTLLATFDRGHVPAGWTPVGTVAADSGVSGRVLWRGEQVDPSGGGWDHFGG